MNLHDRIHHSNATLREAKSDPSDTLFDCHNTGKTLEETQSDLKPLGVNTTSAAIWLKRSLFFSTVWMNKHIKLFDSTSNS
jgi:hypothetical protein